MTDPSPPMTVTISQKAAKVKIEVRDNAGKVVSLNGNSQPYCDLIVLSNCAKIVVVVTPRDGNCNCIQLLRNV